jgi:hypothetical protein
MSTYMYDLVTMRFLHRRDQSLFWLFSTMLTPGLAPSAVASHIIAEYLAAESGGKPGRLLARR